MRPYWVTTGLIMAAAGVALLVIAFGGAGTFSGSTHTLAGLAGGAYLAAGSSVLFSEWKGHR
jgi:hypothetical protein